MQDRNFKISHRKLQGILIVAPVGRLTLDESDGTLLAEVKTYVIDQGAKVIVDLSKVIYTDASGISEISGASSFVKKERGGELKLVNITSKKTLDLIRMMKIEIPLCPDLGTAVQSFSLS